MVRATEKKENRGKERGREGETSFLPFLVTYLDMISLPSFFAETSKSTGLVGLPLPIMTWLPLFKITLSGANPSNLLKSVSCSSRMQLEVISLYMVLLGFGFGFGATFIVNLLR